MTIKAASDTHFTVQVKSLLNRIYGRSILKDSLLDRAISYFENQPFSQHKFTQLKQEIDELNGEKSSKKSAVKVDKLEREYRELKQELSYQSNERHQFLLTLCRDIIELTEGDNFSDSNRKSAQLIGTIQLLIPTQGKKVAENNESCKPLYKAILSLRLLDKLCIDGGKSIDDPHIQAFRENIEGEHFKQFKKIDKDSYQQFVEQVKIPLLMAALLQDIGHFHPDAQQIVCGKDGSLSPYRTLEIEDRKKLLQVNYRETIKFLIDGVGAPIYNGNSKADRDIYNISEHKKLVFIKLLLKAAVAPKQGIGNVLKVPQIYSSIILSTKLSYNYKLLPKVYKALDQNAEKGTCCKRVVDALHKITGDFPLGYGITYIPQDADGNSSDHYEYAIVTQFYPQEEKQPNCRTATRGLKFIAFGQDIVIKAASNLHYTETAKEFALLSKERLNEILELLSSNYQERKELDILPRCWHTYDYFTLKENQKLWNKQGN